MGVSLIEKLLAAGDAITGKAYRVIAAANQASGNAKPLTARPRTGALIVSQDDDDRTAFGRLRVSNPFGLFDVSHQFDKQPLLMDESLGAGGTSTYLPNEAAVRLRIASGTGAGSSVIRQGFQYVPYQPGRSQLILCSAVFGTGVANAIKEVGYFDANNGVFFRQNGARGMQVVRRTFVTGSAVDNVVSQAAWNLDKLDGTGPSGVNVDFAQAQLYVIDFAWLGIGAIRFGMEVGNRVVWCHIMQDHGIATPWMSRGSLPIRYSVRTTGTIGANADLNHICSAVFSDGGFDTPGFQGSTNTRTLLGSSTAIAAGTRRLMLTIRLRTAYNRAILRQLALQSMADTLDSFLCELVLGGTRSGGAATTTQVTDAVEALTGNTTLTGGRVIDSFIADGSTGRATTLESRSKIVVASNIAGTAQELHVTVTAFSAGNFYSGLTWQEIY